jgi:D-glycero-alpha-D-manno-heptose 1-phosphate guanylyltransferase
MPLPGELTAVILAGGLGTRLRSAVGDYPKILASVNNRPFISYLFDQLLCNGFSHVILCTGHGADKVSDAFGNAYKGLSIEYSPETEPLGTGGALRNSLPRIKTNDILVMNGDSYVDADLTTYIEWQYSNNIDVSLLLTWVPDTSRYGRVDIDKNDLITQFVEKSEESTPGWINAGIYILNKNMLSNITSGEPFSLEHEFFPKLVGKSLYGFRFKGSFIDIGIPATYNVADQFF